MKVSKVAIAAAMIAGSSAALFASPASAQRTRTTLQPTRPNPQAEQQQPQQGQYTLSPAERAALAPLLAPVAAAQAAESAGQTPDWAPVRALLPAAVAAAEGPDARYLTARAQLALALGTNDTALQTQALDALIASTVTPSADLPTYLNARATRAFEAQDFQTAERLFTRLLQLNPNDQRVANNLRVVQQRGGNTGGALQTVLQNIRTQEASGGRAPEAMYLDAARLAYQARDRAQAIDFSTRLAQNYPTAGNWRDLIRLWREMARPSDALTLDSLRLARASGGLEGENEYRTYVSIVDQAALPGEAKAVIDEAVARGALRGNDPVVARALATANRRIAEDRSGLDAQVRDARNAAAGRPARVVADALYGYGRYAEAADLYRVAAGKSGEDRNILNLRLGASLAMAGQRAEAETALRSVSGEAAELAKLWLAWLARRQG